MAFSRAQVRRAGTPSDAPTLHTFRIEDMQERCAWRLDGRTYVNHIERSVNTVTFALVTLLCAAGVTFTADFAGATQTITRIAASSAEGTSASESVALAESEALPTSAYPAGWREAGPNGGGGIKDQSYLGGYSPHQAARLESCLRLAASEVQTNPVELPGQLYVDPATHLGVAEYIEIFRSAHAAAIDVQAAGSHRTPGCNKRMGGETGWLVLHNGVRAEIIEAKLSERTIRGDGDHDADLELVTKLKVPNDHLSLTDYSDLVYIQKGRSEAVLIFSGLNVAIPGSLVASLAQAAATRLTES